MHHEEDTSEEMLAALGLKKMEQLGPTGRFPDGKLTANDEGEIAFAVGALKGKVVVNFGAPIASLGMSPKQARGLAALLIQKAQAITESPQRRRNERRRRRRR